MKCLKILYCRKPRNIDKINGWNIIWKFLNVFDEQWILSNFVAKMNKAEIESFLFVASIFRNWHFCWIWIFRWFCEKIKFFKLWKNYSHQIGHQRAILLLKWTNRRRLVFFFFFEISKKRNIIQTLLSWIFRWFWEKIKFLKLWKN